MYFCTVNVNSWVMICTLSSAHWQQAELIWKDCEKCAYQDNNNNNNINNNNISN